MKNFVLCVVALMFVFSAPAISVAQEEGSSCCQERERIVKFVPVKDVLSGVADRARCCAQKVKCHMSKVRDRAKCVMSKKPVRTFLGNIKVPTMKAWRGGCRCTGCR